MGPAAGELGLALPCGGVLDRRELLSSPASGLSPQVTSPGILEGVMFCFWSDEHLDIQLTGSRKWNVQAGDSAWCRVNKTCGW